MQVTRHHEGVYQCSASNGVGSKATAKINLRVLREFTFIPIIDKKKMIILIKITGFMCIINIE